MNGRGAFTHTSYDDFQILAANLLGEGGRRVSQRIPIYALYIDPPLGRCGMTAAQARASGRPVLVGRRPPSSARPAGRASEARPTAASRSSPTPRPTSSSALNDPSASRATR